MRYLTFVASVLAILAVCYALETTTTAETENATDNSEEISEEDTTTTDPSDERSSGSTVNTDENSSENVNNEVSENTNDDSGESSSETTSNEESVNNKDKENEEGNLNESEQEDTPSGKKPGKDEPAVPPPIPPGRPHGRPHGKPDQHGHSKPPKHEAKEIYNRPKGHHHAGKHVHIEPAGFDGFQIHNGHSEPGRLRGREEHRRSELVEIDPRQRGRFAALGGFGISDAFRQQGFGGPLRQWNIQRPADYGGIISRPDFRRYGRI